MGSVPCCTQSIHIYRMCVCVQKKTCLISVAVFGQGNNLNGRLSQKWIDANGSLLQSQMPQARADRQPTSLSPSLSVFLSMCGTKWSATLSKTPRCRAAAGIHLSVLGLSRILSLLLAGSKSNKKKRTNESKEGKRKQKRTKWKNSGTSPASLFSQVNRHILNECKRSLEWKIQKVITYEISAAVTSFQHSACNPHPLQNTYARAHTHTHTEFICTSSPHPNPPTLIICLPSILSPLLTTLLFCHLNSRVFKLVLSLQSHSPWSPLWSPFQLLLS